MNIEESANNLLSALKEKNKDQYDRCRVSIVAQIFDNDFFAEQIKDNLSVGKALFVILDNMPKSGMIYKRVILTAMYCLLKVIYQDRDNEKIETALASLMMFILFAENTDFIGGEYLASNLKSADAAAHQTIGMMCVFLWKYKFSSNQPIIKRRTLQRYQNALSNSITDTPDIATRNKVIDFEYNNFSTMIKCMPIDIELKYPGVPFFDPEFVYPKIRNLFISGSQYLLEDELGSGQSIKSTYEKKEHNSELKPRSNPTISTGSSNGGCLGVMVAIAGTIILLLAI